MDSEWVQESLMEHADRCPKVVVMDTSGSCVLNPHLEGQESASCRVKATKGEIC